MSIEKHVLFCFVFFLGRIPSCLIRFSVSVPCHQNVHLYKAVQFMGWIWLTLHLTQRCG